MFAIGLQVWESMWSHVKQMYYYMYYLISVLSRMLDASYESPGRRFTMVSRGYHFVRYFLIVV